MKKYLLIVLGLFLFSGCSKSIELPKLMAKEITINYGESIDFTYDTLVDLTDFSKDEVEELENNGDIDLREIQYNEDGIIAPGDYEVKVSYYSDVVRAVIHVIDNAIPKFNDVDEVEVPWSWMYFEFGDVIQATSPIGSKLEYTFDTKDINFYERGYYPLYVTVKDEEGRTNEKTVTVHVV